MTEEEAEAPEQSGETIRRCVANLRSSGDSPHWLRVIDISTMMTQVVAMKPNEKPSRKERNTSWVFVSLITIEQHNKSPENPNESDCRPPH